MRVRGIGGAVGSGQPRRLFPPGGDLLVPVGLVLHVWNIEGEGLRLIALARIASWPLEWRGLWWPRALRRPHDIASTCFVASGLSFACCET